MTPDNNPVKFFVEPLAACRDGIATLMEAHGNEFTYFKGKKGPVSPKWEVYEDLERQGRLKICTARHDGEMVGYFLIIIGGSFHYRDLKLCFDDTFYLKPNYRRGFGLYFFVKFCVGVMERFGGAGSCLILAFKANQSMEPIAKRLGFVVEEIRMTKMVGA